MRSLPALVCLGLVLHVSPALAQNEAALKRAFEGQEVTLLMEMPASHQGVDVRPGHDPDIDFADYARRIKQYGVALRKGDPVMVTQVKVNKRHIEFHLGGGGYGTWGDDSGSVYLPAVTKSSRERDLERDIKRETDADRKRRMERELSDLRRDRERDERDREVRQRELTAINQREVAIKRLDGGSRFNIRYDDKRLERWAPTPEELMATIARYVQFGGDGDAAPTRIDTGGPAAAASSIRRGMTVDDVHGLLGPPTRRRESNQGDLVAVVETWETVESVTEVTLVGGVVVKFSSSSK